MTRDLRLHRLRPALVVAAALLVFVSGRSEAQVTSSDYARAERLLGWNAERLLFDAPVRPQWSDDGASFWYRKRVRDGHEFVAVDAGDARRRPAFDHARLAASLSRASGHPYEAHRLPFESIELLEAGGEVVAESVRFWETLEKGAAKPSEESSEETETQEPKSRRWTCRLDTYECEGPDDVADDRDDEVASPDRRWIAFQRDENVWLRDQGSGEEKQLSQDGAEDYGYGVIGEGCCDEITTRRNKGERRPPIFWSPDSKRLATIRLDEREVGELHLLETAEGRPILHSYRYALPGDEAIPKYSVWIFEVESGRAVEVETAPIELTWAREASLEWSGDSSSLFFLAPARGKKAVTLHRVDPTSGATRVVLEETSDSFVETNPTLAERSDWRVTHDGAQLVWRSERDGWGHFYLYDTNRGERIRRLTEGSYSAARIAHVDSEGGWLYFHGYGREPGLNPYWAQLYRVRLDGTSLERLTPEDAHHVTSIPDEGGVIVDTYSTFEQPPITVLRRLDGARRTVLEEADASELLAAGWTPPQPFVVKARDGVTDLHGFLYWPTEIDPEGRYPIVDYIYPGPQIGAVRNWGFEPAPSGFARALAELGFVVFQINAPGTPYRSKRFHDAWYGDMGDNGLADHVHALKQLAARDSRLDIDRVGIYGHSGGGFSSTGAILRFPDFFDVAVSGAGNHDQRSYSFGWGEKYQGLLERSGSGDNFDSQANHLLADRLQGKLLLSYGSLDDNVHPNATLLLVDKLIEHNKDFDLLVLPNRNHGYAREPYLVRRTWDYFVRHLLGEEPPREYRIAPPAR